MTERNADHLLEEGVAIRAANLPALAWKTDPCSINLTCGRSGRRAMSRGGWWSRRSSSAQWQPVTATTSSRIRRFTRAR
jgi:hypothetical protein